MLPNSNEADLIYKPNTENPTDEIAGDLKTRVRAEHGEEETRVQDPKKAEAMARASDEDETRVVNHANHVEALAYDPEAEESNIEHHAQWARLHRGLADDKAKKAAETYDLAQTLKGKKPS